MKVQAFITYSDGQDGSYFVTIEGSLQDALNQLDRTEEQLAEGNVYDDGYMKEIELEIEDGKLVTPIRFSVE